MYEFLSQLVWVIVILLSCKADKTITVHIHFKGVEACDKYVDSQIILQPINKVWIGDILARKNAFSFVDFGVMLNNFYASATTSRHRLKDPKCTGLPLSLTLKEIIVF